MIEVFNNINEWLTVNRVTIIAFLTSGNFAAAVFAVKAVINNIKTVKENTEKTAAIDTVSKNTEEMNKEIADLKASNAKLIEQLNDLAFKNTKYEDTLEKSNSTINTMLDIMGIAYNNLRDDDSRALIQHIIAKSKYCTNKTNTVVEKTTETLEQATEVLDKMTDIKDNVNETIDVIKSNKVSRY